VTIAAAVGEDGWPLSYTELAGNRTVGEEKPSEIPRVMGSVVDVSTLDGGTSSRIEGSLSLENNESTPRSASSSDLGRLPSSYEDPHWLERLSGAFQLSEEEIL
jgi:hypothetical protein